MKRSGWLVIVVLFFVTACFGVKPFQPTKPIYKNFHKENVSSVEVRKAMLECGFPDPHRASHPSYSYEDVVLAGLCMERDGFTYRGDGKTGWCVRMMEPVCNANKADVPVRSVDRRLNSPHCKEHPQIETCH